MNWLFISTGVFLGWSLGANHAVNVFGTAVASRMVRFRTVAIIAGVFVLLGAILSGAGTTRTLNTLGAVNAIAGCFTVALAAGITVAWMTRLKLPVSTSQTVLGGIIGWNIFTGSPTDSVALVSILSAWAVGPFLAACFAFLLFLIITRVLRRTRAHIIHIDAYTRTGLIVVGAVAAYMLGANNIANVMGMFVSASPFPDLTLWGSVRLSGTGLLFGLGGLAIAFGIVTYGERVIATVGKDLYAITPLAGLVVVLAEALVLFLFTSVTLENVLLDAGLPSIPLVPLSSTQVVVGGVIGVGIARGGHGINYRVLLKIAYGWITAPVAAGLLCFVLLFVVQNVFEQQVVRPQHFSLDREVLAEIARTGVDTTTLGSLPAQQFSGYPSLRHAVHQQREWTEHDLAVVFSKAAVDTLNIDSTLVGARFDSAAMSSGQRRALMQLHGREFLHRWQLDRALEDLDPSWRSPSDHGSRAAARRLLALKEDVYDLFGQAR